MRAFFSTLFSFRGTLDRRGYVLTAFFALLALQLLYITIALAFGYPLGLAFGYPLASALTFGYVFPPSNLFIYLFALYNFFIIHTVVRPAFLAIVAALIPFAWLGLAMTLKRFRAIGWPEWLVVLFFVPIANIASFAIAAAWPEGTTSRFAPARHRWLARLVPSDTLGAAVLALMITVVLSIACVALATKVLTQYAWGLFVALPFAQGALSAYFLNVHRKQTVLQSLLVAELSIGLAGLAMLAVALEGALCLLMELPLAVPLAAIGAVFGHAISRVGGLSAAPASLLVLIFLAPTIMDAEVMVPRTAPTYSVTSSVDIDATPTVVWRHVIHFPDLPPPTELPFRFGIAFPERAHIRGSGVGAIRYCEFSTGSFVEPITAWVPEQKLAFDVVQNPEPMREWSPYGSIDTPHLHHYMESKRGQFVLVALPGGRTRLIGTTWYQHHLWPATYWALWSDAIIHQIHLRVLRHIKAISEVDVSIRAVGAVR